MARGGRAPKPYPNVTLERALAVAQQIKAKNAGNPWTTEDVAAAVGHGAKTNEFYYLTAASRDFGLTEGTRNTAQISLTDLGRKLVYARTQQEELAAKKEAFFRIECPPYLHARKLSRPGERVAGRMAQAR